MVHAYIFFNQHLIEKRSSSSKGGKLFGRKVCIIDNSRIYRVRARRRDEIMLLRYLRVCLPRRKENLINFILALLLAGLFCFFYIKIYYNSHYQLPPEVGFTWPTPVVVLHTRPSAKREAKGASCFTTTL